MLAATANPFGARGNKKEKERKLIWLNGHWPPSSSIYWRMSRREQTYVYSGPNLNSPMKTEFFLSCNCWNKIGKSISIILQCSEFAKTSITYNFILVILGIL